MPSEAPVPGAKGQGQGLGAVKGQSLSLGLSLGLLALGLALVVSGCSWLPKVHIISDPLTKEEHLELAMAYEKDGESGIAEREYRAALPLAMAYLGLGNVVYGQGQVPEALACYRRAWRTDRIPAAANNLAWVLLLEEGPKGASLDEALEMAGLAVIQAEEMGLDKAVIDNYRSTLRQVEQAVKAGQKRRGQKRLDQEQGGQEQGG